MAPPKRVIVRGTTGAGKTTLAHSLSQILGVEHVELDALHHLPDWTERPREQLQAMVDEIAQRDGWVIDGNYAHAMDRHLDIADMVVWLDYSFTVVFFRLMSRTVRRLLRKEVLWAGNRESFRKSFFSRDSIIVWMVTTHRRRHRQCLETKRKLAGSSTQFVRLTSPLATELWLAQLR